MSKELENEIPELLICRGEECLLTRNFDDLERYRLINFEQVAARCVDFKLTKKLYKNEQFRHGIWTILEGACHAEETGCSTRFEHFLEVMEITTHKPTLAGRYVSYGELNLLPDKYIFILIPLYS